MKRWIIFCFFSLSSLTWAESTLPVGCQAVEVQGESVKLTFEKSRLAFVHNLTNTDLWITHSGASSDMDSSWAGRLQAGNWSALIVDKPPFVLNCIESRPGHEQQVPCEGVIALCLWLGVEISDKQGGQGTLWTEEDKSLDALTAAVGARGLVLPSGLPTSSRTK